MTMSSCSAAWFIAPPGARATGWTPGNRSAFSSSGPLGSQSSQPVRLATTLVFGCPTLDCQVVPVRGLTVLQETVTSGSFAPSTDCQAPDIAPAERYGSGADDRTTGLLEGASRRSRRSSSPAAGRADRRPSMDRGDDDAF